MWLLRGPVHRCRSNPVKRFARHAALLSIAGFTSVVTIAASGSGGSGTGSGEVIRSGGHILTNNHIISIAAASGGSVEVLFADGQTAPATIPGRDPQTDLAVLKVQTSHQPKVISLGRRHR